MAELMVKHGVGKNSNKPYYALVIHTDLGDDKEDIRFIAFGADNLLKIGVKPCELEIARITGYCTVAYLEWKDNTNVLRKENK